MTSMMAKGGAALRRARAGCGLTQAQLAERAGISRQALSAIEAGTYQPGVSVALALARELGESVEALFGETGQDLSRRIEAAWPRSLPQALSGARVALGRVGGKLVAVTQPAARLSLVAAAGRVERADRRRAEVATYLSPGEIDLSLLVAGCDPAVTLLEAYFAHRRLPVTAVALPSSSRSALIALGEGQVHAAGVHLRDPRTGEYNLGPVRRLLRGRRTALVNFAQWELGFAVARGNPMGINGLPDLSRRNLKVVNRETGAGARLFLDEALADLGIPPAQVAGYGIELQGHLEVACAVARGQADLGVSVRVAAEACGCAFVALREERYDLAILEPDLSSEPVKAMLDTLSSRRFAAEVGQFCGYDTQRMGQIVARVN